MVDGQAIPIRTSKPLPLKGIDPSIQFLLDRLDGVSSVQELAWMNGVPVNRLREEMARLRDLGIVSLDEGGVTPNARITTQSDVIDFDKLKESEASLQSAREQRRSERASTREVTQSEQREQAELLEESIAEEALESIDPLAAPVIDIAGDLPVPRDWPNDFEDYRLPEKWSHLASTIDPVLLRLVAFYLLHLGEVSHYQLLQVEQSADNDQVQRAAEALRAFFDVQRWRDYGEPDIVPAIQRIRRAIGQAESILSDPSVREGYDMALEFMESQR